MIKLKNLKLKNFKSFQKAEIPISNEFTVIAGPNGSGKSNILDALLFVLGNTSLKLIRASKLKDLINSIGSENYAKVELEIKNEKNSWNISRTIDKKGKSFFRLNGEKKTLNEIRSLLSELKIKNDGYNIVAQGDVTRIISQSPVERREIIDEIAGLAEFDGKKQEAQKELEKVSQKIKDITIVMNEREVYLSQLEEEMNAAKQHQELLKKEEKVKATILSLEKKEIQQSVDEINKKIENTAKDKEQSEGKKEELKKEIEENREKSEKITQELLEQGKKTYSEILSEKEKKKGFKKLYEEKISTAEKQVYSNKEKTEELNQMLKNFEKEKTETEQKIKDSKTELNDVENQVKSLKQKRNELKEKADKRRDFFETANEEFSRISGQMDILREELNQKELSIESIKNENMFTRKEINEKEKEIEKIVEKIGSKLSKEEMLKNINSKNPDIKQIIEETETKIDKALEKEKTITGKIEALQETIKILEEDISKCPTCEKELNSHTKTAIIELKHSNKKQLAHLGKKHFNEKHEHKKKLEELKNLLEEKKELDKEVEELEILKERKTELEARINELKNKIKKPDENVDKITELKETLEQLKQKSSSAMEKMENARKGFDFTELKEASEKLSELETRKTLLESEQKAYENKISVQIPVEKEKTSEEIKNLKTETQENEQKMQENEKKILQIESELKDLEKEEKIAEKQSKQREEQKAKIVLKIEKIEKKLEDNERKIKTFEKEESRLELEKGKNEIRLTDLEEEFKEFENVSVLHNMNLPELKQELGRLDKQIEKLGTINMKALDSFQEQKKELEEIKHKVEILQNEKDSVLDLMEQIEFKRTSVFMECFNKINNHFKKMFYNFFEGEGSLSLTDKDNPLESGLVIEARHVGEKMLNIDSMSGGERTLTALAFLFAIQLYDPAPFYVFDEADAALDKVNSVKMARIVKEINKESQFIAITHNDTLIKQADEIIGVALNKQKSSVIGLKLKEKIAA